MDVFVAGGSGFLGRTLCRSLDERGHDVTAASRHPNPGRLPETVATANVDVTDPPLADFVAGHDAIVNLVALPSHRTPQHGSHESVHLGGTRALLDAAETVGVERFVQLSGLGVDAGVETAYFRAKRRAEAVVRNADVPWVIYRPSVVFGDGCAFFAFLESVVPLVVAILPDGGRMRLQPIWVGDLAPMVADAIDEDDHVRRTYELGGPEQLTLARIVELVCDVRLVVSVPGPLVTAGFAVAECLSFVPVGRDQYRVFGHDNVVADNDVNAFGRRSDDLTTLSAYLDGHV